MRLRPKFKMALLSKIEDKIWKEYKSYSKVEAYLNEFHEEWYNERGFPDGENITICRKNDDNIDLPKTLATMDFDTMISMAIDLDIPVPTVLPAFPTFTRTLVEGEFGTSLAYDNFMKAYKLVYEEPEQAISLANSALETIIKHILADKRIKVEYNPNDTLRKLTEAILKEFGYFPTSDLQKNIKGIGSALLRIANEIEEVRSDKTFAHGKGKTDYVVDDNLYSVYIVNSVITVGMFLISFYDKKYPPILPEPEDDDIPF
ncbi:MAG: abortive infection family protein [Alphaproteobacteria bacterium]|nr:abortive infection family protein [Alphaproteobacteria bacterium]